MCSLSLLNSFARRCTSSWEWRPFCLSSTWSWEESFRLLSHHTRSARQFHGWLSCSLVSWQLKGALRRITDITQWITQLKSICVNRCDKVTLTFDLYLDLALISSCDVADHAEVSSLVLYPNAFYLQSPIMMGLKAISFKSPLSIFRPVYASP